MASLANSANRYKSSSKVRMPSGHCTTLARATGVILIRQHRDILRRQESPARNFGHHCLDDAADSWAFAHRFDETAAHTAVNLARSSSCYRSVCSGFGGERG